MGDRAM
jgi:hypothetical protein